MSQVACVPLFRDVNAFKAVSGMEIEDKERDNEAIIV